MAAVPPQADFPLHPVTMMTGPTSFLKADQPKFLAPLLKKNQRLVADEPAEFEK